jgi:hypothetical protein
MTGDNLAESGGESTVSSENGTYKWNVRPYRDEPSRRIVIFAVALLALLGGWLLLRAPLLGLLGFGMILASTMEYWLGSSYRVDGKGASSRTGISLTAIDWSDVRRLIFEEHGIKLSPLEKPSRLDAFRGVFLKFDGQNREQVLQAVRTFGGENVRSLEG